MKWIYLSPHLDDAVYSCGGLIWMQTQAGALVEIWTVCAGDPPPGPLSPFAQELHARWGTGLEVGQVRREEDVRAAARVGATIRHLELPDCIYRRAPTGEALYASEQAIFGEIHPAETGGAWLRQILRNEIPADTAVVCPLSMGGHVDHQLVRTTAEQAGGIRAYYPDFPYAARWEIHAEKRVPPGWARTVFALSEEALHAWGEGIALYASQFSTFWANRDTLEAELRAYAKLYGGVRLWHPGEASLAL
jgi:LmbE family N-acetylglucosaminyl deacetylase